MILFEAPGTNERYNISVCRCRAACTLFWAVRKKKKKRKKTRIVAATNLSIKPQQASSLHSHRNLSRLYLVQKKKRRREKIGTPKYRLVGLSLSIDGRTFTARR
jgi:hypothetical protein